MEFPNVKELKKLAAACRKAGISNFKYQKDGSFEFSLDPTHEEPKSSRKATKQEASQPRGINPDTFESDSPSEDDLLFWSVRDDAGDNKRVIDEGAVA